MTVLPVSIGFRCADRKHDKLVLERQNQICQNSSSASTVPVRIRQKAIRSAGFLGDGLKSPGWQLDSGKTHLFHNICVVIQGPLKAVVIA